MNHSAIRLLRFGLLTWILTLGFQFCLAQIPGQRVDHFSQVKRNPIRLFLNQFSLDVAMGPAFSLNRQNLNDYFFIEQNGASFISPFDEGMAMVYDGYSNWFHNVPETSTTLDPSQPGFQIINPADENLVLRSNSFAVPFNVSLFLDVKEFRLGIGAGREFQFPAAFRMNAENQDFQARYKPEMGIFQVQKYYATAAYRYHTWWDYAFSADIQLGTASLRGNFNNEQVNNLMPLVAVGLSVEKHLSEYFRLFVRGAYEPRSFILTLPNEAGQVINRIPLLALQFGASFTFPEVRRCPMKSCKTQLKHVHADREFRGQPITKKQNPKYGENHPVPFRYKGKNKYLRSPY